MWNKLRVTAMVASLLAGTAALAYAQSSSTLGTGGSSAGGGSTSTTLGTGGSAAGGGSGSGSASTLGTGGSTAAGGPTSPPPGTGRTPQSGGFRGTSIGTQLRRPAIRQSSIRIVRLISRTSTTPAMASTRMITKPIRAAVRRLASS